MRYSNDNKTIMRAIEAQNNGNHARAAGLFQKAGNQYRHPDEKKELWAAAERSNRVYYSD